MAPRRFLNPASMRLHWTFRRYPIPGSDARKSQQVLDEPMHACSPIHCKSNELVGVRVQFPFGIVLRGAACNWPPFSKVPADRGMQCWQNCSKSLVRAYSSSTFFGKMLFRIFAHADVADGSRYPGCLGAPPAGSASSQSGTWFDPFAARPVPAPCQFAGPAPQPESASRQRSAAPQIHRGIMFLTSWPSSSSRL